MTRSRVWPVLGLVVLTSMGLQTEVHARADEALLQEYRAAYPEWFASPQANGRVARPMDVPDIFGPGAVLDVGNIYMKITNYAIIGNAFPGLSSDPSSQWPGSSGVEYLAFILLGVGGVNSDATDPAAIRRVSLQAEWRPQTLDPEDRMYRSYDGIIFGSRMADDDQDAIKHDPLIRDQYLDEDFHDGRDNDGDGLIDEDYGAYGQRMWSCVMWDNTPQALQTTFNEKHIPLNLECRQTAWAYSVPGFQNFNIIKWQVFNRSGHGLDSMYIGVRWDMDAGPLDSPTFFNDDYDIPFFPHGDFTVRLSQDSKWGAKMDPKGFRAQFPHADVNGVPDDSALCPRVVLRVNGYSVADDDGDEGRTSGIPSILLLGHTVDPKGLMGPKRVGWHGFRSFLAGTPYASGGNPATDAQRFEMFESTGGIDPETGFINATPVDQQGDVQGWAMIGPFGNADDHGIRHPIPDGGSFEVTIAFAIERGSNQVVNQFPADYQLYVDGALSSDQLFTKYPALENAFTAQLAYEGVYDNPPAELSEANVFTPDFHGAETHLIAPKGFLLSDSDCRDEGSQRQINEFQYTWFDFDCDYCTGVWVFGAGSQGRNGITGSGKMLRRWNTAAPPPNPNLNVQSIYNFSDNPDRVVTPAGDNVLTLAWDNLPEITVDPEKGHFDFRSYRVWKSANWTRPVGSSGPGDKDWALLGHYRFFDYTAANREMFNIFGPNTTEQQRDSALTARGFWRPGIDSVNVLGVPICPQVFIPNLSVQTIVLSMSRFDANSAADWCFQHGYKYQGNMSQDATSYRFAQADGPCQAGTLHSVGIEDSTVTLEACVNPLAETKGVRVPICLYKNDLWDRQSGSVIRATPGNCPNRAPDGTCLADTIPCLQDPLGCHTETGKVVDLETFITRTQYRVGRYRLVDHEVKNGFTYFYAITAGDSSSNGTGGDTRDDELVGRRAAVEADAVVPQASTRNDKAVWVVPNPYRGYTDLRQRSSAWDLTPNATDPTGTHIDFFGLPRGRWTISIFTLSGDLVQVLRNTDEVNESLRGPAVVRNPNYNPNLPPNSDANPPTILVPGFNRQQDNPNDGQARWNLISRNGQDVVSGVYLFVVQSDLGTQRGKFVIIR